MKGADAIAGKNMMRLAFCFTSFTARRVSHTIPSLGSSRALKPLIYHSNHHVSSIRACTAAASSTSAPTASNLAVKQPKSDDIDALRKRFDSLPPEDFPAAIRLLTEMFTFPLDSFQQDALRALVKGKSVVLSAPTGAGKTIVGEMAIYLALCKRLKVFYTTPLKALSNQKFYDFKKQFGESRVGLLTGDVTINREADVVVMTTEVYRNMLYAESVEGIRGDGSGTDRLLAVVFDEFHYLNDRDRGTVWEESVISSPPHVLLVALSATMSNTSDVKEWFRAVQGETALIESSIRPVPLKFAFCDNEGMTPLFAEMEKRRKKTKKGFGGSKKKRKENEETLKLHPKLLRKLKKDAGLDDRRKKGRGESPIDDDREIMKSRYKAIVARRGRRNPFAEIPSFPFVVRTLRRNDMLPCIVFIFSRAGCDRAAKNAAMERERLVTPEEEEKIRERLDAFREQHPGLVNQERIDLALQGIASHHAGLLPLWKVCVEELFQDGLIKVVFATETLAAGINMPARTTVISSLSKRAGEDGFVDLTTSEVLQMAGRAGRRGKDVVGHSMVLRSKKEGALEAFRVVTSDVDELESKFTPNYGMVLNLLSSRPLEEAKKLVDRSFGNFLRQKRISEQSKEKVEDDEQDDDIEIIRLEKAALDLVLKECKEIISQVDEKELRSYNKGLERVKAEKRALQYLVQQSVESETELIEETLTFAPTGTRLLLKQKKSRPSVGAERRQKRRDYTSAITAAGEGDLGAELKAFYLGATDYDFEDIDMQGEREETEVLEAVLLDMHSESTGILPMFAAVDANGDMRIFNHTGVSKILFDLDTIPVEELVDGWGAMGLPGRGTWKSLGGDQYFAALPAELECLLDPVQKWRDERKDSKSDSMTKDRMTEENSHPEVTAQQKRVENAKEMVRRQELHSRDDLGVILAARKAIPKLEATLSGEMDPWGSRRRKSKRGKKNRYAKLFKKGATEEENAIAIEEATMNSSWEEFMALTSVLQHYGFLDEKYDVTSLGELGAKVRSDNELWTSLVLLDPSLQDVSPVHLGAILGATQMDSSRSDVYIDYQVSEETKKVVQIAQAERARLMGVQAEFGVLTSVLLDAELMGLVEKWATGISWVELLSGTSLQEGDACRILRRSMDMLRQVKYLPVVSEEVKRNAKRAVTLLDRFPVTDERTYVVRDNERENEENEDRG